MPGDLGPSARTSNPIESVFSTVQHRTLLGAAIRQFQVLPHGDKGIGFGDHHLSQYSAGAFTCKFAQRIVNRFTLTVAMTVISRRPQSIVVTRIPAELRPARHESKLCGW